MNIFFRKFVTYSEVMRFILIIIIVLLMGSATQTNAQSSFYDIKVETLEGETFDFAQLAGKKVLIVNTASRCGYTPQYEDLQKLYETYGDEEFTIIGFPANNFFKQEPGSNEKIRNFCDSKYSITFPMMAKISVKGKNIHPVYEWLASKDKNGKMDTSVKWNFQKYMIDENGELVGLFQPKVKPMDPEVIAWIEGED